MEKAEKTSTAIIIFYLNIMKRVILDANKFEYNNTEKSKQFNFILKSKTEVLDLVKRLKNEFINSKSKY